MRKLRIQLDLPENKSVGREQKNLDIPTSSALEDTSSFAMRNPYNSELTHEISKSHRPIRNDTSHNVRHIVERITGLTGSFFDSIGAGTRRHASAPIPATIEPRAFTRTTTSTVERGQEEATAVGCCMM